MTNTKQAMPFLNIRPLNTHQHGLVLIVTLLALVILLLASVALIRSTDANLQIAGNMAFKRDVMNQAERAVPEVQKLFTSGTLSAISARDQNSEANNYYASVLPTNESGIPKKLLTITSNKIVGQGGVDVFYVIDRMCLDVGEVTSQRCALASSNVSGFQGVDGEIGSVSPVYRITLRATGPKNTEAYLQTTFSD